MLWQVNFSCLHYSLYEDPTFSIHSLAHTGSLCLLRCHDYIATCTSARALNVSPVIDIQSLTTSYPCDSYIDLLLAADLCVDAYLFRPNFPVNSRVCHLLIIALP